MKEIPLTQGKITLVDDVDYEWINKWKWCVHGVKRKGIFYAQRGVYVGKNQKDSFLMHREIMKPEKGFVIDHIDGNGLNNQRVNLRVCTYQQNNMNNGKIKSKTSIYKGVSLYLGKWMAVIHLNNKSIYLGWYGCEQEAAHAYDEKARELFGEFSHLNFPDRMQ